MKNRLSELHKEFEYCDKQCQKNNKKFDRFYKLYCIFKRLHMVGVCKLCLDKMVSAHTKSGEFLEKMKGINEETKFLYI